MVYTFFTDTRLEKSWWRQRCLTGSLNFFFVSGFVRSVSSKVWESCILVAAHLQLLVVISYMSYWGCFWRCDSTLSSVSRSYYVWFVSIGWWSLMLFLIFSVSGTDHPHVLHCLGVRCLTFLCLNELGGFCCCNYYPCIYMCKLERRGHRSCKYL